MSPFVVFVAVASLLLAVFVVRRRSSKLLPPSPPAIPVLGHLHLMGRLPHRSIQALQRRYGGGDGLLLLQLGRRRTLVASTAAAAADLYKNHDLAFASRPHNAAGYRLMYGHNNVSFAPYGEPWRRGKKVAVVHLLSPRRVAEFAPVRVAEAGLLVARAHAAAVAGEEVNLRGLLYSYTNSVVTRAVAGATGATVERLNQLMGGSATLVAGFQADDVLPAPAARVVSWLTGVDKMLDNIAGDWDKLLTEILANHKESGLDAAAAAREEDFVDVMLRLMKDGANEAEITEDRIKGVVKDMIAAATETTSVTLEWAMAELMANPRVMAKLQDEVTRVAGGKPAIGEDDLGRMEYLKAVVKEVLRLRPPAPFLIPHQSTAATVVQGYEIPAKTTLFINAWAVGRDPAAWDAPEEFRPERFLGGGVDFRGADYQFVPFGAGRRICPGINFALPAMDLALASLMYHFDWELAAGVTELDMSEEPGITTPLRVPLRLVAKCRALA